jgi:hypothetical protein
MTPHSIECHSLGECHNVFPLTGFSVSCNALASAGQPSADKNHPGQNIGVKQAWMERYFEQHPECFQEHEDGSHTPIYKKLLRLVQGISPPLHFTIMTGICRKPLFPLV